MKPLYMAVTADKYELPIAVEDTVVGLAAKVGVSANLISSDISKGNSGRYRGVKFIKICQGEEE